MELEDDDLELGDEGGGGDSGLSGESGGAAGVWDPESDGGLFESGGLSSSS
jgi:hypothetical protein